MIICEKIIKYYCQTIRSNLDEHSYKLFFNRIKLSKKIHNWYNHRIFNLRFLKQNVFPKSLFVKSPDKSIRSIKAAITATRTFIRERIHIATMNLESLRSRVKNIDEILSVIAPKEIRSNIKEFFKLREQFYHQSSKLRQIRKFEKMLKHASNSKVKQTRDKSNTVDINKSVS